MRVLITGASGLAGGYLAEACVAAGDEVLGISRSGQTVSDAAGEARAVDLEDAGAVREAFQTFRPEVVYHLAALSSVGRSWEEPGTTLSGNVMGAVNVLEATRATSPGARVLWTSTCEVYGTAGQLPITESAPIAPENPYAVSKVAGEQLAAVYARAHGLDVVRARPFNHTGPRQRPIFLASSLAQQAAAARRTGTTSVTIVTGNPDTRRDFTDVRDVVRAYRQLVEHGVSGEVYNVSSAASISAGEQVRLVGQLLAPVEVVHEVDPARVRAHEVMDLRGAYDRLHALTGWAPRIPFRETMRDMIAWWEAHPE